MTRRLVFLALLALLSSCARNSRPQDAGRVVALLDRLDEADIHQGGDLEDLVFGEAVRGLDLSRPCDEWQLFDADGSRLDPPVGPPLVLPPGATMAARLPIPSGASGGALEVETGGGDFRLRAFSLPPDHTQPDLRSPSDLAPLLVRLRPVQLPEARPDPDRPGVLVARLGPSTRPPALLMLLEAPPEGGVVRSLRFRAFSAGAERLLPSDRPDPFVRIVRSGDDHRESLLLVTPATAVFGLRASSEARLRFSLTSLADAEAVRLRVSVSGHQRLDVEIEPGRSGFRPFEVALRPEEADERGTWRIVFEATGGSGLHALAIAHPVVIPEALLGADGSRDRRPDLLLLSLDTLRADHAPGAPGAADHSPFLHDWARRALVFTRAFSTSSWTLPSHASLFTGLDPTRHGTLAPETRLPARTVPTLARLLSRAGYRTAGFCASGYVHADFGFAAGFERYVCRELYRCERTGSEPWRWTWDGAWQAVVDALEDDDPRPIFLFVHTYAAHDYRCTDDEAERFGGIPSPEADLRGRYPPALFPTAASGAKAGPRVRAAVRALYAGAVLGADRLARRAIETFEERSPRPGWIVVTSDHGEELFERGRVGHNGEPWETLLHVPLLVAGPALEPGACDALVSGVDITPTLLELARAERPADLDGRSLVPLFEGRRLPPRPIFAATQNFCSLRGERFKCVAQFDADRRIVRFRLFDLRADPGETNDVSSEHPDVRDRLLAALASRLERPAAAPERMELSPERERELRALGYLGDG